jgi:hypothetical protein
MLDRFERAYCCGNPAAMGAIRGSSPRDASLSIIGFDDEMAWSRSGSAMDGNQGHPAGAYDI